MSSHIVLDAHRQQLRCTHCRAEVPLPAAGSLPTWIAAINEFETPHKACIRRPLPAPTVLATASAGHCLKRDDQGLWWSWVTVGRPQGTVSAPMTFQVQPLPLAQALSFLQAQVTELEPSENHDDHRRAEQAVQALLSEGVFV